MHSCSVSMEGPMATKLEQGENSKDAPSVKPPKRGSTIVDVVIPSNILGNGQPGPYIIGATQNERPEDIESGPSFNVQEIAWGQREAIKRTMGRSASAPVGFMDRSTAVGYDSYGKDFIIAAPQGVLRKTSLVERREQVGDHVTDYFGNYGFKARSQKATPITTPASPEESPFHRSARNVIATEDWATGLPSDTISRISVEKDTALDPRPSISEDIRKGSVIRRAGSIFADAIENTQHAIRKTSIYDIYEKAKIRGVQMQRTKMAMITFEYAFYLVLVGFVYLVLVGVPLWKGAVYWLWWVFGHKFSIPGTWAVTIGVAALYAYAPLLIFFEKDPPLSEKSPSQTPGVLDTALMIPCYKSAKIIGPTLEAATKIFPASHIFVVANGNSPTPLDETEEVCKVYGVNHVWSPIGSKIVAQFVGCYAAKGYKNVILIDDDCALPPNFPIVSDRMTDRIKCIGYTIKSVGPESSRGTLCQQAQDLEYKISGMQRAFAGKIGSATFPHGAISLWDLDFLIQTFREHPGFSVSEDWFFGHVARELGSRIQMCTSVLIETETPSAVFLSSGGARGGFGEMTIFKQRFMRWNFFFVNGMWYNTAYIFGSWRLGWWEFGAKLFVFQEVYETLLYLLSPFVLPISFIVRPSFSGYLFAGTFALYFLNIVIFNELHLRLKNERVKSKCVYLYYMPYKMVLTAINVGSCYWSLYKYATYFAKRHPRIVEDEKAVDVVLRMEEASAAQAGEGGRRMTVTAIGSQLHGSILDDPGHDSVSRERKSTITTLGPRLDVDARALEPLFERRSLEVLSNVPESSFITVGGTKMSFSEDEHGSQRSNGAEDIGAFGGIRRESFQDRGSIIREHDTLQYPAPSQPLPGKPSRGFSNRSIRRSGSSTPSSRRSRSFRESSRRFDTDFASVDFSELMDRLTAINERLNH